MNNRYFAAGVILTALLVGGIFLLKKNRPVVPHKLSAVAASAKIRGPENAPVQIVEYSDFQCPACQRAQSSLNRFLADYEGKIQLVFRHYPLPGHVWAGIAHQAAECANEQGRFWEYHDRLYAEQKKWSGPEMPMETFLRYGRDLGLNLDRFGACFADQNVVKRIQNEKKGGVNLQVNSTPTFFINGERLVGPVDLEMKGENVIRKALGMPEKNSDAQPQK